MQEALLSLRRNNRYYTEIDYAALNALPDNGPLPDPQVIEDDDLIQPAYAADDITDTASVNANTESSDDGSDALLQSTVLPKLRSRKSESDYIPQAVNHVSSSKVTLPWFLNRYRHSLNQTKERSG